MTEELIWMVWGRQGAAFVDDFLDKHFVGIGFKAEGDIRSPVDKSAILATMWSKNPNGKFMMTAS